MFHGECVQFFLFISLSLSLHLSLNRRGRWGTTDDFATSFLRYGMVACFHHMVSHGQITTWRNPSLSRSNTGPLSSSWNPSAKLALFFLLWKYPPCDAVLTPAILHLTARLVEGGSALFLPVQAHRNSLSIFQLDLCVGVVPMTCSCADADGKTFFLDYFDWPVGARHGTANHHGGKECESVVLEPSTGASRS